MRRAIPKFVASFTLSICASADDDRIPRLQAVGGGERIEPLAVARCRFAGGKLTLLGDWMTPAVNLRGPQFVYAYDCFESDSTDLATLAPTDNPPPGGCTTQIPAGQRWFFGPAYNNPFVSADLTTSVGGAGRLCEGVVHSWYWRVGDNEPDHDGDGLPDARCFIMFQTFETMDTLRCRDDGSDLLDGLIVDLGFRPTPEFLYYVALDLSTIAVTLPMPADGVGGYQIRYFIDVPPKGDPVLAPGINVATQLGVNAQPMLWGTSDAEPIFDNRAGFQNANQFDDDQPSDGFHNLALECYEYHFGVCPDPLGASTGFLYRTDADCPCPADLDADGVVGTGDLTILLTEFGITCPCENECVDFNFSGIVDLADLTLLLGSFGTDCP